mgnify:CR=1 FL=1
MDGSDEKYAVCPERNTPAAFRWFYEPLNVLAYLLYMSEMPAGSVKLPPDGAQLADLTFERAKP